MAKKSFVATVLAMTTAALIVPGIRAGADSTVSCDGSFPIFQTTAASEDENRARIDCVDERKDAIHERIDAGRTKRRDINHRIEVLRQRRTRVNDRLRAAHEELQPLNAVTALLDYVVGEIDWLNVTSGCESGNDPQAHNGDHHGKLQFKMSTWLSLEWAHRYGDVDPHTLPAIVQDAGGVELKHRTGDEQWPTCGDIVP